MCARRVPSSAIHLIDSALLNGQFAIGCTRLLRRCSLQLDANRAAARLRLASRP